MHLMSISLMAPGAELRALEELDYMKVTLHTSMIEKKRKEEAEKIHFKRLKKQYDQLLNMRKIQLGVSVANKKNAQMRMIYDFGISDKEFSVNSKHNMGLPDLQLYDLSQEEAQNALCVNLIMKKFRKGF